MKLITGIVALALTVGTAWAQNPAIIQNTKDALNAAQQKQTAASNAALQGTTTAKPSGAVPAKSSPATAAKAPAVVPAKAPVQSAPAKPQAAPAKTPVLVPAKAPVQSAPTKPQVVPVKAAAAPAKSAVPAKAMAPAPTQAATKPQAPAKSQTATKTPSPMAPKTAKAPAKPEVKVAAKPEVKPAAKQAAKAAAANSPKPDSSETEAANPDKPTEDKKYSMTGKRDPFISPVVNRASGSGCSTGKKCLDIEQIALHGVVKSDNGMIAVVTNGLNKAYFLRENDPVFNGYVVKITVDSIVFKETLQDRLGKPFTKDVVKRILTPAV
jgi:Tfp pilus assembly protein PilP